MYPYSFLLLLFVLVMCIYLSVCMCVCVCVCVCVFSDLSFSDNVSVESMVHDRDKLLSFLSNLEEEFIRTGYHTSVLIPANTENTDTSTETQVNDATNHMMEITKKANSEPYLPANATLEERAKVNKDTHTHIE